ncbi:response regulator transcription factor [Streptacidiphilus fuscans]|uniref:Response regulator transcription factor n=1 Tax=Streptacidiphilus fuscans TaxID=2789292 RepID=A0A931B0Y7_9ACTN|nr:response regulator transcription factor [Streptacidiphilus fuscans]MBF9067147.1 response regulator transcription factor [Streptacidiphilus fuscans]
MISILIAEDMLLLRKALASLLTLEDDLEVVAETARGDEVLPLALRLRPDVAVLDAELPGMDGITACRQLHDQLPSCRTMILTEVGGPGRLRRALAAHAVGYMLTDSDPTVLTTAIRSVAKGGHAIEPRLALAALEAGSSPLTPRDFEVLRLTADGEDVKEIASRLYLASGTVRNYLTNIVTKLNARNRVDAVRIAQEAGWL